jgi:hypothetical protein
VEARNMLRVRNSQWRAPLLFLGLTVGVAQTAAADDVTVAWDPSASPDVIGYIVHVGTQSGKYTQSFDVGLTNQFVFHDAVAGQNYYFAVAAYGAVASVSTLSEEVSTSSNAPPHITPPGDQTSTVGVTASLQLAGSDPAGEPVTFSSSGLPPGLVMVGSTGYITGTPSAAGKYSVTATVSDGALTDSVAFKWTVNDGSDQTAPTIQIATPTKRSSYSTPKALVTLGGTAADNRAVTRVRWSSDRGGAGEATGTDKWNAAVPLQKGVNVITVTALDAAGNVGSAQITIRSSASR